MKHFLRTLGLFLICFSLRGQSCSCTPKDVSHFFMFTRPLTQNLVLRQSVWNFLINNKQGPLRGALEVTTAYQESNFAPENREYFTLCCSSNMLVAGDALVNQVPYRRIRAEWLGLPATFAGTFTVQPRQQQGGAFLSFNQDLDAFIDHPFFDGTWVGCTVPVVWARNNMHLTQTTYSTVVTPGQHGLCSNNAPATIAEAFSQNAWLYAKIRGPESCLKISDLVLYFGKTYIARDYTLVAQYNAIYIPTGNIQDPSFVFNPVVGNNGNFGYGSAVNFQVPVNRDTTRHALCWFLDVESIYFARNEQMRTFDLLYKPLSRYLLLVDKNDPSGSTIPGVNVLTQKVRVKPYNMVDFSTGFRFITEHFIFEANYGIWGHGTEKIRLRYPFPTNFGIAGNNNALNQKPLVVCANNSPQYAPATASNSTISCLAPNDVALGLDGLPVVDADGKTQRIFVPITVTDLDFNAPASQHALNHKAQLAISFLFSSETVSSFCTMGIFYDKPVKRGALTLTGFWLKFGSSF